MINNDILRYHSNFIRCVLHSDFSYYSTHTLIYIYRCIYIYLYSCIYIYISYIYTYSILLYIVTIYNYQSFIQVVEISGSKVMATSVTRLPLDQKKWHFISMNYPPRRLTCLAGKSPFLIGDTSSNYYCKLLFFSISCSFFWGCSN